MSVTALLTIEVFDDVDTQATVTVTAWLGAFEQGITSEDEAQVALLFEAHSHWRDVLAFTWHITPQAGAKQIARDVVARQSVVKAQGFEISATRTPRRHVKRVGRECIEAIFCFKTAVGRGEGVLRLVPDPHAGGAAGHKAWLISTSLKELKVFEEKIGDNRPSGAAYSRNFGGDNWEDAQRKAQLYEDHEPTVLVVGGAQAGLSVAAQLNQLGVDTLVVEKWLRVGDSWRKRYHSLALHNSIHVNNLPFMPFPQT
jgi:hypothetical protein